MNFNIKTEDRAFNITYVAVVGIIFVLTLVCFSSIFIFSSQTGILAKNEENDQQSDVPAVNYDAETAAKITGLKQTIESYDEMLASSYLLLVNKQHALPEAFAPANLVQTVTNPAVKLDTVVAAALQQFIEDAAAQGIVCTIVSGYRSSEAQNSLYNETVQSNMNAGYDKETAENMTSLIVAKAGESEAETGYTVEISVRSNMSAEDMEESELFKYAKENMYKYGFILRYPQGKDTVTGYKFNPFCFRYVGYTGETNHAQYIYDKNITLEEYVAYLSNKKAEAEQSLSVAENSTNK